VYRETDAEGTEQRVVVTVTGDTRMVMGIEALAVRDVVTEDGELVEDTFDWYAQDDDGNVWYLGEETKEYEGGEVTTTAGSWEAGVDGALPGVVVPAGSGGGHAPTGVLRRRRDGGGSASRSARRSYGTFDDVS
jgi:hypothetical protein